MLIVPHTRHARHRERARHAPRKLNVMDGDFMTFARRTVFGRLDELEGGNSQLVEKCKLLRGFELHSIFFRPDKQHFHTITSDSGPGECAIKLD